MLWFHKVSVLLLTSFQASYIENYAFATKVSSMKEVLNNLIYPFKAIEKSFFVVVQFPKIPNDFKKFFIETNWLDLHI